MTLLLLIVVGLAIPAWAQQSCSRTIADTPPIFGLKLGMSFEQMQSALSPGIKLKRKKSGEGSYFENFIDRRPPANLPGVRAIFFRIFNNRLYQVEVFFEDDGKPVDLDAFITRLSTEQNLPRAAWTIKNSNAIINCGEFSIEANTILNPRVQITDTAADNAVREKRQQQKEGKSS